MIAKSDGGAFYTPPSDYIFGNVPKRKWCNIYILNKQTAYVICVF